MNDKTWDGLTIERELKIGVLFAGTRHRRIVLRVPLAGDLIRAQQAHPDGPMRLQALECYRQQLVVLGDIPAEHITTKLLGEQLTEIDLAVLEQADRDLGNALSGPSETAKPAPGDSSSTSSSDTATG